MEKRDIIVIFAAIVVVLIMAVVVKPMLTGQPVLFLPESPESEIPPIDYQETPIPQYQETQGEQVSPSTQPPIEPTKTPEEALPSAPKVTQVPTPMTWQPDPDNPMPAVQMITYAEIVGKYSGSSSLFRIPTPYWELHYNVTPANPGAVFSLDVKESMDGDERIIRTLTWKEGKASDPRDYRFFEGGKDYLLNITANQLDEYRIIIQIPLKYIRDT